jgi:hypothetical protein
MNPIQADSHQADPRPTTPYISKSKFLWGLQCHKLLWHAYNAKHLIPGPDARQQTVFDQGHEVGGLSKELFHAESKSPKESTILTKSSTSHMSTSAPAFLIAKTRSAQDAAERRERGCEVK